MLYLVKNTTKAVLFKRNIKLEISILLNSWLLYSIMTDFFL